LLLLAIIIMNTTTVMVVCLRVGNGSLYSDFAMILGSVEESILAVRMYDLLDRWMEECGMSRGTNT
jgi:hypothetical protein